MAKSEQFFTSPGFSNLLLPLLLVTVLASVDTGTLEGGGAGADCVFASRDTSACEDTVTFAATSAFTLSALQVVSETAANPLAIRDITCLRLTNELSTLSLTLISLFEIEEKRIVRLLDDVAHVEGTDGWMEGKKECADSTNASSDKRPSCRLWIGNMLNVDDAGRVSVRGQDADSGRGGTKEKRR